ncbi:MAG TPA: carboxylating nicotinate-nucleotide diphosphorylase [Firmicutes bacterium]|nr:carboxylating nicotinate-nucleotide diphosphorylase [Bacillota bacterium]
MNWQSPFIVDLIKRALEEDIWTGDITTEATIPEERQAVARVWTKVDGVIAGLPLFKQVFLQVDPTLQVELLVGDGFVATAGTTLAHISGSARSILQAERVALNFLQRLSGIATRTSRLAEAIKFYQARIVDTRKTTPGLRMLEKYAVRMGGGYNHRFGLYDAVLIKDNHIAVAGGIKEAVTAVRRRIGHTTKIEVEVETLEQLCEALESRADIIMLDNMSIDTMKEAVKQAHGKAILEASGGISEENIVEVAKTGVDYISVGAITHSVRALDISLDIALEQQPLEQEENE